MRPALPRSTPGVADIQLLLGADAPADVTPTLLIEVPHGADRLADYQAVAEQLVGALPDDLHHFFHVNTDVGAWQLGERVAQRWLLANPGCSALLVRCLIPRTFVDCNRVPAIAGGDLSAGGMTAGIPAYMTDPADIARLLDLHAQYAALATTAFDAVCGAGGLALIPHTYAPRSVGIQRIDADIVRALHAVYAPDVVETWPLRAEVDVLTRDAEGRCLAPPRAEPLLIDAFVQAGFQAVLNDTYFLHPATLGYQWCAQWPGQVVTLEVRRDLLVAAWDPFVEMHADPARTDAVAAPLAQALIALSRG